MGVLNKIAPHVEVNTDRYGGDLVGCKNGVVKQLIAVCGEGCGHSDHNQK